MANWHSKCDKVFYFWFVAQTPPLTLNPTPKIVVVGTHDKLIKGLNGAVTPVASYLFMRPIKEGSGHSHKRF